jgi:hypothetical protein
LNAERHTDKQMTRKGNKCVVFEDDVVVGVVVVIVVAMLYP